MPLLQSFGNEPVGEMRQSGPTQAEGLGRDFQLFFIGQTTSSLGSAFTRFALPLLVFHLTGSPVNLALTVTATFLPVVLFGLIIGVWVDRVDRKRLMIITDIGRAAVIAWLPLLASLDLLSVGWIYAAAFASSLLAMVFETSQVSAIASLVPRDDLMRANGRLQASYSATGVLGSLLAGLVVAVLPVPLLLLGDALSFLISAGALALISRRFNDAAGHEEDAPALRTELLAGVRYVVGQPVLLCLAVMLALINFVGITPDTQLVLFAKQRLQASDSQVGLLYAAGGAGVVILSLLAGRLRRRFAYGQVALGALMLHGLFIAAFAAAPWYWAALPLWSLSTGVEALFNIATASLVQAIIPDHLMGRVISVLRVLAWSAIPLGTALGGLVIERTGQVDVVYAVIGGLILCVALAFTFTPLGRVDLLTPTDRSD